MKIEDVVALIDEIGTDSCDLGEIRLEFHFATASVGGRLVEAMRDALRWPFPRADVDPPPAPPDLLKAWDELAVRVRAPAVSGRLHDLLWIHQYGDRPHEHARHAIEGYVSAVEASPNKIHWSTLLLERALELACETNALGLFEGIRSQAHWGLMLGIRPGDGHAREDDVLRRVQLLVDIRGAEHDEQLTARFGDVRRLFTNSWIHDREALILLEQRLAAKRHDEAARERLQRELVDIWRDYAETRQRKSSPSLSGPSVRDALSKALEYAADLPDRGSMMLEIRQQMARARSDDRNTGRLSVSVDVPVEFADAIAGDDGLGAALGRLGWLGPPVGQSGPQPDPTPSRGREASVAIMDLMPQTVEDERGRPIRRNVTGERRREAREAVFHSAHAALALDAIGERYRPDQDQLTKLFSDGFGQPSVAQSLAGSFIDYWDGRIERAIHVALTRIEGVLRSMFEASGGVVYNEPRPGRDGHEKMLGTIIREIPEQSLPNGWRRSLIVILTEPTGLNLRNRYLHGQVQEAQKGDAALILQIVAYLWVVAPTEAQAG